MLNIRLFLVGILCVIASSTIFAQCPENIGFDFGTFKNWVGATGQVNIDGSLNFDSFGITTGVHTLYYAKDKQTDPYGGFPIISPNGSSCCVKLGNNIPSGKAD